MNKVFNEDCLTGMRKLEDNSIDCCVTSPPYYGLMDYGHSDQIGLETSPDLYVNKMVQVFEQVKRVLKKEGTLWLNLGDSYNTTLGTTSYTGMNEAGSSELRFNKKPRLKNIKIKDLIGIPWLVAFALRSAGWYLRQDIIWHKPNPMPESVTDRCTKSHEYIFLLSKSEKYYYDAKAIGGQLLESSIQRLSQNVEMQLGSELPGKINGNMKAVKRVFNANNHNGLSMKTGAGGNRNDLGRGNEEIKSDWVNKRSVWTVTTKPFSEAHFATFPEDLIVDCIKAGSPEGGVVLDPFMGAFTTALVASKLNRNFIGFELNKDYIKIGEKRLRDQLGMFHP